MADLIDLLGAMGDYFEARDELNELQRQCDPPESFEYYGAGAMDRTARALERVNQEWDKVMDAERVRS